MNFKIGIILTVKKRSLNEISQETFIITITVVRKLPLLW